MAGQARDRIARLNADGSLDADFDPDASGNAADRYFGLRAGLQALFGRPVDLVMMGALQNRFFIDSINESRRPLYAA